MKKFTKGLESIWVISSGGLSYIKSERRPGGQNMEKWSSKGRVGQLCRSRPLCRGLQTATPPLDGGLASTEAQQAPGSQGRPASLLTGGRKRTPQFWSAPRGLELSHGACGGHPLPSGSAEEQASIGREEKVETGWVGGSWCCCDLSLECTASPPLPSWRVNGEGRGKEPQPRLYPNAWGGFGGNPSLYGLSESPAPESPAFASDLDRDAAFVSKKPM